MTRQSEELLRLVPDMDLPFDGDCTQGNGLQLPVVVINLPHRTDRWDTLAGRMAAVGLTRLIKAPAVAGAKLPDDQIEALLHDPAEGGIDAAPRSHFALTRPAIGCSLSHLAIWRWIIASGLPRVLVFEDDAAPVAGHDPDHFRTVVSSLPADAGLVFPGRLIMDGLADRPDGTPLARLYYFNGTFAYLITPDACRTLLGHLLPLRCHIDHQISRVLIEQRHVFPAHYTDPAFFEPDWSQRSDVYVPIENEANADQEFGRVLDRTRRMLLAEGRPLLPGG